MYQYARKSSLVNKIEKMTFFFFFFFTLPSERKLIRKAFWTVADFKGRYLNSLMHLVGLKGN